MKKNFWSGNNILLIKFSDNYNHIESIINDLNAGQRIMFAAGFFQIVVFL